MIQVTKDTIILLGAKKMTCKKYYIHSRKSHEGAIAIEDIVQHNKGKVQQAYHYHYAYERKFKAVPQQSGRRQKYTLLSSLCSTVFVFLARAV